MGRRGIALIAAILGLLGVVLAAAGNHWVPMGGENARRLWATAIQMHLFHCAVLLGLAALMVPDRPSPLRWSALLMVVGVVLFSGSLYLRAGGMDIVPGPLTPLGGLFLMSGWVAMLLILVRKNLF